MDTIDTLFAEYQALKAEQKLRWMDHKGHEDLFYNQTTELTVTRRMAELRQQIQEIHKNQ